MSLKKKIITVLNKLPYISTLHQESMTYRNNSCFAPGHFYSPIVAVEDIKKRQDDIWPNKRQDEIAGINLNTQEQIKLVKEFGKYYNDMPFTDTKNEKGRYYFENIFYSYTDAIFLYSMLRHYRPKQIIEIGSGFSSSVMLDTNNLFLNNEMNLTFIEPYADRLKSLLTKVDVATTTLIESNVQGVSLDTFDKLNAGDILFVDGTHVVKTGSDVNYVLFEIMPRLKSGVLIHFHDVFFPFEYPKSWVFEGRNWNEDYFLKAFLMYNKEFEIKLFSDFLHRNYKEIFEDMPLCYKNSGGNLWLEKK